MQRQFISQQLHVYCLMILGNSTSKLKCPTRLYREMFPAVASEPCRDILFFRPRPMVSLSGTIKASPFSNLCTPEYINKTCVQRFEAEIQHWHRWTSSNCRAKHVEASYEEVEENISTLTLIWRAIKLPIYSVALVPLTVGSAVAYFQTGNFSSRQFYILLVSSVLIITWLNLSNDVYDFDTGADKNKKESVVNIIGSRTGTFFAACFLLALGFTGLTWASIVCGNVRSLLLLTSAITCGYIYQCPPFRLSYQGLGEPLCFAAFGPFATTAFYLSQSGMSELPITGTILSASILVGFTTTLILFCSHFHQIEGDKAAGKMSPLVRLGTETGAWVLKVAVNILYLLLFIFGFTEALPFSCVLLGALTLPVRKTVINYVEENHKEKSKIFKAKYYCVRLHAIFGAALAAGLIMARMFARKYVPKSITL